MHQGSKRLHNMTAKLVVLLTKSEVTHGMIDALGTVTAPNNSYHFWADYLLKWTQEKWACDSHDDATPLSFQLQVTEDFLKIP